MKESILVQLFKLNNHEAYYISSLFHDDHIPKPQWFWVVQFLSLISISSVLLSFFFPQFLILLISILAINYIIHYWNKKNLYQYGGAFPQLLILNQVAKELIKSKALPGSKEELNKSIKIIDSVGSRMSLFRL